MTGPAEFPILEVGRLAEKESRRKEIYRPVYHLHKWWAQRLGSVFRAILIYLMDPAKNAWDAFHAENEYDKTVFDPFMGSGTTLGEALKLGARVVGRDINPVSSFLVKQALAQIPLHELERHMARLAAAVSDEIKQYYVTRDERAVSGMPVLYYFWVKQARTPDGEKIPLFSKYVFSQNAYASKKPAAQILCPVCWSVFSGIYNSTSATCESCASSFDPQAGPAKGAYALDSKGNRHKLKSLLPKNGRFEEKMFALLAVGAGGRKEYRRITDFDLNLYRSAAERLEREKLPIPEMPVAPGYNTDQARGHNYNSWRDFFNARQLLCLGLLLAEIQRIDDAGVREQFLCLFSGTLEFNNMFCSYKGEGTGAVRPIFSNHILKPERTPLENSVWGTAHSSGCFSTLYRTRLLPAKRYLEKPFELKLAGDGKAGKAYSGRPLKPRMVSSFGELQETAGGAFVTCGDSASVPLPDASIDLVVTDPPYFDYVHYSELSDFFYAWLSPVLSGRHGEFRGQSSRRPNEVQRRSRDEFAATLAGVLKECRRVMKDEAKLCFSFHHARPDGWAAMIESLAGAGFYVDEALPIHAEFAASTAKAGAKEPISIDIILVCAKQPQSAGRESAESQVGRLLAAGKRLSRSDIFVVFAGQTLVHCVNARLAKTDALRILEEDRARAMAFEPGAFGCAGQADGPKARNSRQALGDGGSKDEAFAQMALVV